MALIQMDYGMVMIMREDMKPLGLRWRAIARLCCVTLWVGLMAMGWGGGWAIASSDTMPDATPRSMHSTSMRGSTGGGDQAMPGDQPPMECCNQARNRRRMNDRQEDGLETPVQENLDAPTELNSAYSEMANPEMANPEVPSANSEVNSTSEPDVQPLKTYSLTLIPDSPRQQVTIDPPAIRLSVAIELGTSAVRVGDRLDSYRVSPGQPITIEREADAAVTQLWAQNSGGGNGRLRIDVVESLKAQSSLQNEESQMQINRGGDR